MKKLTINKIGVMSLANFLGLMGVVTGAIKAISLPVLALIGSGGLADVDAAVKSVSTAVSACRKLREAINSGANMKRVARRAKKIKGGWPMTSTPAKRSIRSHRVRGRHLLTML